MGDSSATLFTVPYQQNLSPPEPGGVPIPVGLGLRQDGGDGNDRLYGDAYTGFVTVGGVGPGPPAPPTFLVPGAGIGGSGAGGDDYLDGGVDTLKGNGDDILVGDAMSMARSTASGGGDFLYGGDGNDALAGDALRDDNGLGGNDWLFGEASDDTLRGGSGNDTLDGGDGTDTAVFDGDLADFKVGGGSAENGILVTELATGATDILFHAELLRFSDIDYLLAQVTSQWFAARAARARGSAEVGRENDDGATEDGLVLGDACGRVRHVRRGRCGLGAKRQLPDAGGENKARQLLLSRRSRMCRQVQRPDDLLSSVRHRGPQVVRRERRLQLIPPRRLVISCR